MADVRTGIDVHVIDLQMGVKVSQGRVTRPWAVYGRGLLLVGAVGWIVGGFDF